MTKRIETLIIAILLLVPTVTAAEKRDSIIVSLVTCWPGPEVYELCGHEAVRVRSATGATPLDSVWNYGVFDFAQPHFIYRFVKGETDYMLAAYPFRYFLPEYYMQGRRVVEQDLNLSQEEAWKLLGLLREESLPENRTYRYNYVKDNCATRILDRMSESTGSRIIYPDSIRYGTFRKEMRSYHRDYPWYQFGIDLALGSGIDYPLRGREEMFVPLEMMRKVGEAHFEDGRPLVRATRTLNVGVGDATLGPTHWSATPLVCCWLFFGMICAVSYLQWRRRRIYRAIYSVWFGLVGLTGCLLTFLIFVSEHEATSPNLLWMWLNPLQLIIAVGVWCRRRCRWVLTVMTYYNLIVVPVMLIVWPFQTQSANAALFPLMGATVVLSLVYAINSAKNSYKNSYSTRKDEEARKLGADRTGRAGRAGTKRTGKAPTGGRNRR